MAYPYQLPAALSNTPVQLQAGVRGEVQTIEVRNPDAATGAYVKLYQSVEAPTGSSLPSWSAWVAGATARTLPAFAAGANWWIAVATEARAGLSAPVTAFDVSYTFEP